MSNRVDITVSVRCATWRTDLPEAEELCRRAAAAALAGGGVDGAANGVELAVVLADDRMLRRLNRRYRGVDAATNVLSFAAADAPGPGVGQAAPHGTPLELGDVVVALETVRGEAAAQNKPLAHHLSHLVVHGVLHLLGFDHQSEGEAAAMEALEARVLDGLGLPDPYAPRPLAAG